MPISFSNHPDTAWLLTHDRTLALLRKETAPLIVTFLFDTFRRANRPTCTGSELHARLTDWLFDLNDGAEQYGRTAKQYIEEWVKDQFLRRYYETGADEATYELTSATERAFRWLNELTQSEFVGTESRLLNVFNLLKEITQNTSDDQTARLAELEREKQRIDAEIRRVRAGEFVTYDAARIRDRYSLLEETAGRLLADFRQVEQNFRDLNQQVRQDQIRTQLSKGRFLDDVFRQQDQIMESDQGRSFTAFWEFLMNTTRQDELQAMLRHVLNLPDVQKVQHDRQLNRLDTSLVEAGDRVNRATHRLTAQLRQYVDAKHYLHGRRLAELIAEVEEAAVQLQPEPPTDRAFFTIDGKPDYGLFWDRPHFSPPQPPQFESDQLTEGVQSDAVAADRLYEQVYVDSNVLVDRIRRLLKSRSQVSLPDVLREYPIEKGLTELLVYFRIATVWERDQKAHIDPDNPDPIEYFADGNPTTVRVPRTIYLR